MRFREFAFLWNISPDCWMKVLALKKFSLQFSCTARKKFLLKLFSLFSDCSRFLANRCSALPNESENYEPNVAYKTVYTSSSRSSRCCCEQREFNFAWNSVKLSAFHKTLNSRAMFNHAFQANERFIKVQSIYSLQCCPSSGRLWTGTCESKFD